MRETISELRFRCQKPGEWQRLNKYYKMYRLVSIYFTRLFLYTPVTANQVSFLNILLVFFSGIFLIQGTVSGSLIGVGLLFLVAILDRVDGEIARYRGTMSAKGEYIDQVMHLLFKIVFFSCIAIPLYRSTGQEIYLLAGFIAVSFSLANTITGSVASGLRKAQTNSFDNTKKTSNMLSKISKLISLPQAFMKEIFVLFIILSMNNWFILLYAAYLPLFWIAFTIASSRTLH